MTIRYERFTVAFVQNSDGFTSYRDFYRASLGSGYSDIVGIGQSKEDAAVDLMRQLVKLVKTETANG